MQTLRSTAFLALLFAMVAGCGQEAQEEARQETPADTVSEIDFENVLLALSATRMARSPRFIR